MADKKVTVNVGTDSCRNYTIYVVDIWGPSPFTPFHLSLSFLFPLPFPPLLPYTKSQTHGLQYLVPYITGGEWGLERERELY